MKKGLGFIERVDWLRVVGFAVPFVLMGASAAFASGGCPGGETVCYGTAGNAAAAGPIIKALAELINTIRTILGWTAFAALVVAALINHFVHDPRAKDRAREIIVAGIVGLGIAIFAPEIINFVVSL